MCGWLEDFVVGFWKIFLEDPRNGGSEAVEKLL